MSSWSKNIGHAIDVGRRSSIDILTRLRPATSPKKRNNYEEEEEQRKQLNLSPIQKNYSAPILIEEQPNEMELETFKVKHASKKEICIIPMQKSEELDAKLWQQHGNNHLGLVLSALYAKILVVCGTAFSLSEVISSYIPVAFYDGFYLYLYFMSILFMVCILGAVVKEKAQKKAASFARQSRRHFQRKAKQQPQIEAVAKIESESRKSSSDFSSTSESPPSSPTQSDTAANDLPTARKRISAREEIVREKGTHFGSFYLRIGAVAFGIGSMIYTGLEFGQYFELKPDEKCHNLMLALTPSVKLVFTFLQMYFIFLNSKMAVSKVSLTSQYGTMHMVGTNLCVWVNTIVQETRHEILNFYDPYNKTISFRFEKAHKAYLNLEADQMEVETVEHVRVTRGLKGPHTMNECGRTNIMGSIVQDAAPFLFPCTIEFSLICAAVCFVMWKNLAKRKTARVHHTHKSTVPSSHIISRSPHSYSVDCARANKGLFVGIFFLVLTIMSIIINLVLDTKEEYRELANLEVHITEIVLYTTASFAVIIGMCQIRVLRYSKQRNLELDNILLIVAQTGSLIFNVFTIISGHFKGEKLVLILALSKVVQLLLQTVFILDASNRAASTMEQAKKKPGREVVTYLLVTNLCMWLMNALETSRGESHPSQLQLFGIWSWTIIVHISMPLAIFYRFHSTVCLANIWKRAFKLKRR